MVLFRYDQMFIQEHVDYLSTPVNILLDDKELPVIDFPLLRLPCNLPPRYCGFGIHHTCCFCLFSRTRPLAGNYGRVKYCAVSLLAQGTI